MRERPRLGAPLAIAGCAALLITALWASGLHLVASEREQAVALAQRENANLAYTLGEQNGGALRSAEATLRAAAETWARGGGLDALATHADRLVHRVVRVDAAGRIALDNHETLDASDRDYYLAHRDDPSPALHVSPPLRSALSGEVIIPLSIRLVDAQGRFAGAMVASLRPEYFSELYGKPDLGVHGSVVLVGTDGVIRARRGNNGFRPGMLLADSTLLKRQRVAPQGNFVSRGAYDGVRRYTSYYTITDYPSLVIAVGRDENEVLGAWRRGARLDVALIALATAFVLLLAAIAFVSLGRQRRHVLALAASEARFREIHDSAVEGIFQTRPDGRYVSANPAMARICGYASAAELMASVPDVRQGYRDPGRRLEFQRLIEAEGRVTDFEYELVRADGCVIWVSENARAVRDGAGRVTHYEGFLSDITARKREEELRELAAGVALRRYRELLARLGVLAEALTEAGDVRAIHHAALAFARESAPVDGMFVSLLDEERRERHCVFAWREGLEEDDAALAALPTSSGPHSRAVSTGCVVVTDELTPANDRGPERDARLPQSSLVVPMQVMGRVIGGFEIQSAQRAAYREEHVVALQVAAPLVAMALDNVRLLAEERAHRDRAEQAERRNAAILDSAMDAIITIDVDDRIVDFNPFAERLFALPRRQAIGRSLAQLILPAWLHEEYGEALQACLRDARSCDGGARTETTALRSDGNVFSVELSVTRVPGSEPVLLTAFLRDITERQRAVLALRQSESRYREAADELAHVIDGSLDAICILDGESRFVRVSAAGQLIWGFAPDQLVGRDYLELVHPDDAAKTRACASSVMGGLPTREFENRCIRADGSVAYVMWSARWRPEDGTMLAVARDVTHGKLMAEANRHLASRLHEALDNLTSGFATVDAHWRVTYVNREAEVIVGRPREAMVGGLLWDAVQGLAGSAFESHYRCAMAERVTVEFEEFLPQLGRGFEVRAYPTTDGGLAIYFHDVTERQRALRLLEQSERRFEQVALATSDAVWDWSCDTDEVWWSEGLKKLFGYEPGGEMRRMQGWLDAIHPHDRERVVATYWEALHSQALRWSGEYRFRRHDGAYATVVDQASILRDGAGRAVRLVGGMTDITERRELERQLMRTQRIDSLGTLAGGIAHDLNNVFTPILMGLDLLDAEVASAEGGDIVGMVRTSAMRGAEMVKQVLQFARGMEGERLEVNPRLLLEELERMIRETFPRNIAIRMRCDARAPTITGDPTQLHQVLLNLCVNARDAMPGGGTLSLRVRELGTATALRAVNGQMPPGRYVAIEVEDTGCGIDDPLLERIFDPFFTTKPQGEGTGLGLSTSLAIVRKHDGFVQVKTTPGAGSRFSIYLPAREATGLVRATPAPDGAPRGRGETILLVDDEEGIRKLARRALESAGYRVLTAENGAEALAVFRGDPAVDLVVTDMMMPVMDGAALLAALGELAPGVPVICTSGIAPASAHTAPPGRFIAKPYTSERLVAAVQQALPGRAAA